MRIVCLNFALEYERTPKKPKSYLRIRDVLERECRVGRFFYLALERNLESLLVDCFAGTAAAIYVGLAPDFRSSVREMKVIDASHGSGEDATTRYGVTEHLRTKEMASLACYSLNSSNIPDRECLVA